MSESEVARLRRQNHEAAERRDREMAALQSRVAQFENAYRRAKEGARGTPVDWTDDPPSRQPDGWWNYTSSNNRDLLMAAAMDARVARTLLERVASDDFGHALHDRFYGGVDPRGHNTNPDGSPFGDCYKCRVVADFVREWLDSCDPHLEAVFSETAKNTTKTARTESA